MIILRIFAYFEVFAQLEYVRIFFFFFVISKAHIINNFYVTRDIFNVRFFTKTQ